MYYKAVVMGVSAGGLYALTQIISDLPENFSLPIIIVQHCLPGSDSYLTEHLSSLGSIKVTEALAGYPVKPGCGYVAPPGYHLLIERDKMFSLNVDPPVSYARPSIDVLFESAAAAYKDKLIAVILTGANSDGSNGITEVKKSGGLTIAQNPDTAEVRAMPESAIKTGAVDYIFTLKEIASFLKHINKQNEGNNEN